MLMVRTKFPGGTIYCRAVSGIGSTLTEYGNGTMRITTRQDFPFHGILKANLRQTIQLERGADYDRGGLRRCAEECHSAPDAFADPFDGFDSREVEVVSRALLPVHAPRSEMQFGLMARNSI